MKNSIYLIATAIVVGLLLSSCKNVEPEIPENIALYSQFKVGNYWIYQDYRIDSFEVEKPLKTIDSVYILKDTLINNKKYFVFTGSNYGNSIWPKYQRDSLGYIVNEKGIKLFSTSNNTGYLFTDRIWTPNTEGTESPLILWKTNWKMEPNKTTISVPAGEFEVLVNHGYSTTYYYNNLNVLVDSVKADQYSYYAANVGQIKRVFHYFSQFKEKSRHELRLLRYKVN